MAASGFTPIQLFYSTTVSQAPSAGSLVNGELAINITDGKLFYKDNLGAVQVLATKAAAQTTFQTSLGGLTPSTATSGAVTLAGTLNTTSGGTGLTSWTAGDLPYYATGTALSKLGIGTNGQILTSTGTAPQWSTLSGVAVTTFSAGTTGFTPSSATSGAVTLAGTLATTNGGTGLTSFTANGVVYASSTSALTTGSALTFDGSGLTVGGLNDGGKLTLYGAAGFSGTGLSIYENSTGNGARLRLSQDAGVVVYNATFSGGSNAHAWQIGNQEGMRLTSTGLGIGTSTVNTKTQIQVGDVMPAGSGTMNTGVVIQQSGVGQALNFGSSSTNGYSWINSAYSNNSGIAAPLVFMTGATERMRLDSSGNLGLGVTPSAWGGAYKAIQFGIDGVLNATTSTTNGVILAKNFFNNGAGNRYINTDFASFYQQVSGQHQWYTAPSGTAGNAISFTQAMTLDASGQLIVGDTAQNGVSSRGYFRQSGDGDWRGISVVSASTSQFVGGLYIDTSGVFNIAQSYLGTGSYQAIAFKTGGSERARITSGGDLLVKKTSFGGTATGIDLGANGFVGSYSPDTTNATSTFAAYSNGASAYRFYVGWGGTVYATSTTITAISDRRLKENIQDIDVGLDAVMALKPRKFDWKAGKGKDKKGDRGWIAQEFEQVFPEMIDTWRDPAPEGEEPYKAVNADLIPVLVKAIQEQQAIITDLRARVAQLEAK